MNKGLILFGCFFSNVVIFGRCCCNNNNNKSKSSTESVEIKFKKLVCKCFGLQESDIISVKSADKLIPVNNIFNVDERDASACVINYKIGSRFLWCLLRKAANADINLLTGCMPTIDVDCKYLEEGFSVEFPNERGKYYYKLKK